EGFSGPKGYGDMWHVCEEAKADGQDWESFLAVHCKKVAREFPTQSHEINKWFNVCRVQFPLYMDWWQHNPDEKQRTPLAQEMTFSVPYTLPSGRLILLRGKWDAIDYI